jgi:hypothetical protein
VLSKPELLRNTRPRANRKRVQSFKRATIFSQDLGRVKVAAAEDQEEEEEEEEEDPLVVSTSPQTSRATVRSLSLQMTEESLAKTKR